MTNWTCLSNGYLGGEASRRSNMDNSDRWERDWFDRIGELSIKALSCAAPWDRVTPYVARSHVSDAPLIRWGEKRSEHRRNHDSRFPIRKTAPMKLLYWRDGIARWWSEGYVNEEERSWIKGHNEFAYREKWGKVMDYDSLSASGLFAGQQMNDTAAWTSGQSRKCNQ